MRMKGREERSSNTIYLFKSHIIEMVVVRVRNNRMKEATGRY